MSAAGPSQGANYAPPGGSAAAELAHEAASVGAVISAAGPSQRVRGGVWIRGGLRMMHAPAGEPARHGCSDPLPSARSAAAELANEAASVGAHR
jgi:hypothetical protein